MRADFGIHTDAGIARRTEGLGIGCVKDLPTENQLVFFVVRHAKRLVQPEVDDEEGRPAKDVAVPHLTRIAVPKTIVGELRVVPEIGLSSPLVRARTRISNPENVIGNLPVGVPAARFEGGTPRAAAIPTEDTVDGPSSQERVERSGDAGSKSLAAAVGQIIEPVGVDDGLVSKSETPRSRSGLIGFLIKAALPVSAEFCKPEAVSKDLLQV